MCTKFHCNQIRGLGFMEEQTDRKQFWKWSITIWVAKCLRKFYFLTKSNLQERFLYSFIASFTVLFQTFYEISPFCVSTKDRYHNLVTQIVYNVKMFVYVCVNVCILSFCEYILTLVIIKFMYFEWQFSK